VVCAASVIAIVRFAATSAALGFTIAGKPESQESARIA
jgi:hypothetical protein